VGFGLVVLGLAPERILVSVVVSSGKRMCDNYTECVSENLRLGLDLGYGLCLGFIARIELGLGLRFCHGQRLGRGPRFDLGLGLGCGRSFKRKKIYDNLSFGPDNKVIDAKNALGVFAGIQSLVYSCLVLLV